MQRTLTMQAVLIALWLTLTGMTLDAKKNNEAVRALRLPVQYGYGKHAVTTIVPFRRRDMATSKGLFSMDDIFKAVRKRAPSRAGIREVTRNSYSTFEILLY